MKNEWKIDTYGDSEQLHGHKVTVCKVWTEQYTDVYSHDHRPSINQLEIRLLTDAGNVVEGRLLGVCACAPQTNGKQRRTWRMKRNFNFRNVGNGTMYKWLFWWWTAFQRNLYPWSSKEQRSRRFDHKATYSSTKLSSLAFLLPFMYICTILYYTILLEDDGTSVFYFDMLRYVWKWAPWRRSALSEYTEVYITFHCQ